MSNGQYYNGGPPAGQPHPLSSYDQPYAPPPPVQYDQPRQSFQDHTSDYHLPDDTRSFDSQTYLQPGGPGQYDVGSVVPTNQYPPQPSPSPQSWRNSIMGGGPPTPGPRADWYGYEGTEGSGFRQAYATLMGRRPTMKVPRGNYVVDVPAPSQIRSDEAEHNEMKHLRYSAATCDPDDFMRNKFTLRPYLWGRRTELFIVMTMYNENADLLLRTLNNVIKNIEHLVNRKNSSTWGPGSWKKVVVCIVADGRKPCDPGVLKVLQLMGVYAPGVAHNSVAEVQGGKTVDKQVQAHIFEYTTNVMVMENREMGWTACPIQIMFCLKEQNKKKINSHRWFFNAFGPLIKPNVCVLLDVGTKPRVTSIYELYKVFQKNANVGGACGEIYAGKGTLGKLLFNPLVAGQNFEYKMSNILDKPFESVFGFISVLPGAFSAYRYSALLGQPLEKYFHGEMMNLPGATAGIMERNMFLAEDRILAFEIVTKKNAKWRLQYVKAAKASTDVPTRVPEFISQRRRWLNGSVFASLYALVHFYRFWTSGHGIIRKLFLQILMIYNLISQLFQLMALSSYYLAFFFLVSSSVAGSSEPFFGAGDEIFGIFNKLYIAVIVIVLVCSLGNRPQGSNAWYTLCIFLFACCQIILLYCAGFTVYQAVPHTVEGWKDTKALFNNRTFVDLALSLLATYGLYFISSVMYLDPWHMFTSFFQYLLLLPSYVNILLLYAFCNLHDVSWGTKGDNGAATDLGKVILTTEGGQQVLLAGVPKAKHVEALWKEVRAELKAPVKKKENSKPDANALATARSDSDRNFRTNVLVLFLGSNMAAIYVFSASFFTNWVKNNFAKDASGTFNPYLTFIFYCVLGLSAMRFTGCTLYLILNLIGF